MTTLLELIAKRHEGSGWQVFTELPNGTGGRSTRRADAVAIGLWPSHKYEIHGYEIKHDRGDVRRELKDIAKSDAIGRYCDYWSLVVSDLSIIKDLLLPPTWGVLVPERGELDLRGTGRPALVSRSRLRVHRKPAKRKATPISRAFAAAMLQNMGKAWIPRSTHVQVLERVRELETTRSQTATDDETVELERLRESVSRFERESGVTLGDGNCRVPWQFGYIGKAVRVVLAAQADLARTASKASILERFADNARSLADEITREAAALRAALEALDAPQETPETPDTAEANAVPPAPADREAVADLAEQVQAP
jgi:hypothetical protein